jgi:hypothetical protein
MSLHVGQRGFELQTMQLSQFRTGSDHSTHIIEQWLPYMWFTLLILTGFCAWVNTKVLTMHVPLTLLNLFALLMNAPTIVARSHKVIGKYSLLVLSKAIVQLEHNLDSLSFVEWRCSSTKTMHESTIGHGRNTWKCWVIPYIATVSAALSQSAVLENRLDDAASRDSEHRAGRRNDGWIWWDIKSVVWRGELGRVMHRSSSAWGVQSIRLHFMVSFQMRTINHSIDEQFDLISSPLFDAFIYHISGIFTW